MAGKDATSLFKALHPPGTLEEYAIDPTSLIDGSADDSEDVGKPRFVGLVDRDTIVALPMDEGQKTAEGERVPLGQIIGLPDFEVSCMFCVRSRAYGAGGDCTSHSKYCAMLPIAGRAVWSSLLPPFPLLLCRRNGFTRSV